jgi:CRP/FNR family transcriptional regulator, cyclic AMP receptor protein
MRLVTTQLLAQVPLFVNLDEEELKELRSLMTERIFQPGQSIMRAGEPGTAFQIIEQGEVELWLTDTEGKKVVMEVLGPGKYFGELSILAGETRSASAISQEHVVTLELSQTEFFAFLRRRPDAALDVLTELGERLKHTDAILRNRVSRNPNEAAEERLSLSQRVADGIATFSGSILFLLLNLVAFVGWIVLNISGLTRRSFDPYPFQFLTMAVSLEAIFLSIFVLISQNRQAAKDRLKADLDYQVDVKVEGEMTVLSARLRDMERKLQHIHTDLLASQAGQEPRTSSAEAGEGSPPGSVLLHGTPYTQ